MSMSLVYCRREDSNLMHSLQSRMSQCLAGTNTIVSNIMITNNIGKTITSSIHTHRCICNCYFLKALPLYFQSNHKNSCFNLYSTWAVEMTNLTIIRNRNTVCLIEAFCCLWYKTKKKKKSKCKNGALCYTMERALEVRNKDTRGVWCILKIASL